MKDNCFFIKNNNQHHKVEIDEILWLESYGNYAAIQTDESKYLVNFSLKNLIKKFPANRFVRIHQQFSINSYRMTAVDLLNNKVLLESTALPLGRTYRKILLKRLNRI